jgi:hypothetical protein
MEEDYSPQDGEFGFNIYNKFWYSGSNRSKEIFDAISISPFLPPGSEILNNFVRIPIA